MKYSLYTLVDISYTGQYRNEPDKKLQRNQQQNFDTVIQTLELRSNISYDKKPAVLIEKASDYGFNSTSEQKIWNFEWETEQVDVYIKDENHIGQLIEDFQFVPFITNLDETAIIQKPIFITQGTGLNIVFKIKQ
jgi:hypothetical protein